MNIAIVCDPVGKQVGGSFISTLRFAELLSKRGHKIIFITARYPNTPEIDSYKGMKMYRFRSVKMPYTENQFYIGFPKKKELKEIFLKEKIDILHVMIPTPSAIPSINAAKELKLGIVAHSHTQPENILLHLPRFMRCRLLDSLFYKYMIWIYKKAGIVICPSQFSERLLKEHNSGISTIVISNGVNLSKFKKNKINKFAKKHKFNAKEKRVLFVGRLHPEKKVNTLIESMPLVLNKFNNVHLDIVGIGHLRSSLEELSKRLGLQKRVTFYGKVSDEDLVEAYNACDIFVLPSLAELEGMVILEAMACGKPIIIANSPLSASTYFVRGNGFLFKPEDERDLADKLLKLLMNGKLMKKMALASHKLSREFDINESVSKIERVYREVLK